jgi:hypothetical protein
MNMSRSWIFAHACLLGVLAHVIGRQPREALYPVDRAGRPDLRYYMAPLAHYVEMYEPYLTGVRINGARQSDGRRLFELRVHAVWGLIARGPDAMDYAQTLLRHKDAEAREDGAAILAAVSQRSAPTP